MRGFSRSAPLLALTALLAAVACIHVRPQPAFAKATTMEQYERAMWDAIQAGRWQQVQAHIAESYIASTPDGFRDRTATLADLQKMKVTAFTLTDLQSQPNGSDMVVTYTLTVPGQRPLRVMTVWQTVTRGWIEIAQSFTPAP